MNPGEKEGTSVPVVISRSPGSRVRRGKTNRDERNVRDRVGRGGRLHERFEGPPVEVKVEGALREDGPRRKECP